MLVNISKIKINDGRRPVNQEAVRQLADSIREIGLINPITITKDCTLISGAHRIEAFKLLGKTEIAANFMNITGLKAELAEIDENLVRNELDDISIGELAIRRDEILEALGERANLSNKGKTGKYQVTGAESAPVKTTSDMANNIGISERVLQENKQLARKLAPEVKTVVREADIPKTDALKLARMEPEKQKAVAEKIASGEAKSVIDAQRKVLKETIVSGYEERTAETESADIFTAGKKYRVIYADPPWAYGDARSGQGTTGAADHYPSLPLKDICGLPVKDISDENAVLFLWVTSPLLEECFDVIRAWGFKYKACFVWDKVKHNMGHYNSVRHEFLLVCTRGSCVPDTPKLYDSVQTVERTEHSRKPEVFRDIIDTLYGPGSRVELFARSRVKGWDAWGYEAP